MAWNLGLMGAAAGVAGAYDLLVTTEIGTDSASITFDNLNTLAAGYKHLQVRAMTQNTGGSIASLFLQFNSDTGNNYAWHYLFTNSSSPSSAAVTSTDRMIVGNTIAGSVGSIFAPAVIDILDFSNSSKTTTVRALSGTRLGNRLFMSSGFWNNTSAVTSLTFTDTSNNLKSGTRISIYGVK